MRTWSALAVLIFAGTFVGLSPAATTSAISPTSDEDELLQKEKQLLQSAEARAEHLKRAVDRALGNGAAKVNIIAHSMGGHVLLRTLADRKPLKNCRHRFHNHIG